MMHGCLPGTPDSRSPAVCYPIIPRERHTRELGTYRLFKWNRTQGLEISCHLCRRLIISERLSSAISISRIDHLFTFQSYEVCTLTLTTLPLIRHLEIWRKRVYQLLNIMKMVSHTMRRRQRSYSGSSTWLFCR